MLTVCERALLDEFYAARDALSEASRRWPHALTQDDWDGQVASAIVRFRDAEAALVDEIRTHGEIEADDSRFSVRPVAGLGPRLKVEPVVRVIRLHLRPLAEPTHAA